jgi:ribonuclease J
LVDFGAEVITDRDALVHTSGHPRRDELRQMYDWIKPQIVVPVHGEALHLHEQAKVARAAGVPQVIEIRNGPMLRLAPGKAERVDTVPHGRLYRDGRLLVGHEGSGVGERRRLAFAGVVAVAVVLSDSGDVLEDPAISLVGLPAEDRGGERLVAIVEESVDQALDSLPKAKRRDAGLVRESVKRAVRGAVDVAWGKKPTTIVHVTHVSD